MTIPLSIRPKESDLWNRSLGDNSTRLDMMGWLQYGLDYSAILFDDGNNQWKAGIGLNYLQGLVAAYVRNTHLNYILDSTSSKDWDMETAPLSLLYYGTWRARVGLTVRAGYVFLGGDASVGLLSLGNMQGVDVYAGVRFFVFKH